MQATSGSKSFIEVLEAEIRADLRREIEAEVQAKYGFASPANPVEKAPSAAVHAASRLELWLASNIGPITVTKAQANAQKAYGASLKPKAAKVSAAPAPPPTATAPETLLTVTTSEQFMALEILNRQSTKKLGSTFSESELKSVWRKAALKSHPDRFAGADDVTQLRMTALFRELAEAYACLTDLIEASKSRAA